MCKSCKRKDIEVGPYVMSLYHSAMLIDAGFPMKEDTFEMSYWLDLAVMRRAIHAASGGCPLLGG